MSVPIDLDDDDDDGGGLTVGVASELAASDAAVSAALGSAATPSF